MAKKKIKKHRICPICGNDVIAFIPKDRPYLCWSCKNFIYHDEFIYELPKKEEKKRKGRGWIG